MMKNYTMQERKSERKSKDAASNVLRARAGGVEGPFLIHFLFLFN